MNEPLSVVPGLSLRLGDVLAGRYRIEELVGCEASVVTLHARAVHGREPVTVEVLVGYSDVDRAQVDERITRARVAAHLQGANVARVLDIGKTPDGLPYVVTTRALGPTLEDELVSRGRFELAEAVDLAMQICAALGEAHAYGLVHGDVEPRRIVLTTEGDGSLHATLLGFGVASAISSLGEASASSWFGSPSYIAPEQSRTGEVDARSDVWSVGVLLHELVSGAPPFDGESASAVLVAVAYDAAPLLTDAPYDLAKIVARCLDKNPDARPQSMEELATLLAPYAGATGTMRRNGVVANAEAARRRAAREKARGVGRGAKREPSPLAMIGKGAVVPKPERTPARRERTSAPPPARHEKHLAKVLLEAGGRESALPFPLVTRRDQPTAPSKRVRSERRLTRARAAAVVVVAAALGCASAAWAGNKMGRAIERVLSARTHAAETATALAIEEAEGEAPPEGASDVLVVGRAPMAPPVSHGVMPAPEPTPPPLVVVEADESPVAASALPDATPAPRATAPKAASTSKSAPRRGLAVRTYPEPAAPAAKGGVTYGSPGPMAIAPPPPSSSKARTTTTRSSRGTSTSSSSSKGDGARLFTDRK